MLQFQVIEGKLKFGDSIILEIGDIVEIDNIPEVIESQVFYGMYRDENNQLWSIYSSNLYYDEDKDEYYDDYNNGKINVYQFDANEDRDPQYIYYWIDQPKGSSPELTCLKIKNNQGESIILKS